MCPASGTVSASLSGSSIANTAVLGRVLLPDMLRLGYHPTVSIGPILGIGGVAMLIPPSALAVLLGPGASRMVSIWIVNAGCNPPRIGVESISALTTAGLLSKTALLGIFSVSVARSFTQLGLLRQLPVSLPRTEFPVGVIYRREQEHSPLIHTLIDHCIAATRHLS